MQLSCEGGVRGPTGEQEVVGWGAMEKGGPRRGQSTAKWLHGQGTKEELGLRPPTTPANRAGSGTGFQVPAENGLSQMAWPLGHHPREGISRLAGFRPEDNAVLLCSMPRTSYRGCGSWMPHGAGTGVCLGHCCVARVRALANSV